MHRRLTDYGSWHRVGGTCNSNHSHHSTSLPLLTLSPNPKPALQVTDNVLIMAWGFYENLKGAIGKSELVAVCSEHAYHEPVIFQILTP